jgi:hypothetical protein
MEVDIEERLDRPWIKTRPLHKINSDVKDRNIMVSYIDFSILAKYLGSIDEADDLAKCSKQKIEEYISSPESVIKWILDYQEFSIRDLWQAFTHGCGNSKNKLKHYYCENTYTDIHGLHKRYLGSTGTFLYLLSRGFLLAAKSSIECDNEIRWYLYFEDLLKSLCQSVQTSRLMVKLLEARSIDFFLPAINSKDWNSKWNVHYLFDQIASLTNALVLLGRKEESAALAVEITKRKAAYLNMTEIIPPRDNSNKFRLKAEDSWRTYLGDITWESLNSESRSDLIDSYIAQIATDSGLYTSWRYSLQSMLYVVERELNITFFSVLKNQIDKSVPFDKSIKDSSRRLHTYNAILTARNNTKSLTLGELSYLLLYWNDDVMDQCTNLFSNMRIYFQHFVENPNIHVSNILAAFSETFGSANPPWDIVRLRNSCAHPGNESRHKDQTLNSKLRSILGEPPRLLLYETTVALRGLRTNAY